MMREKPKQKRHNQNRIRIIALSFGVLLIAMIIGIAVYLSDYYQADESVQAALADSGTVRVSEENNWTIFMPEQRSSDVGFVFYPGGKVDELAYAPVMHALAEQDILCVLVSMPFRLAVLRSGAAAAVIDEFPEINQWFIGGHSLGGAMAASFASNYPALLEGVILLAAYPPSDLSQSDLRLLSIYGDQDSVLSMDRYTDNKAYFPDDLVEIIIGGGNHAYFGNYGEQAGDGQAQISREEQQRITIEAIITFFDH